MSLNKERQNSFSLSCLSTFPSQIDSFSQFIVVEEGRQRQKLEHELSQQSEENEEQGKKFNFRHFAVCFNYPIICCGPLLGSTFILKFNSNLIHWWLNTLLTFNLKCMWNCWIKWACMMQFHSSLNSRFSLSKTFLLSINPKLH